MDSPTALLTLVGLAIALAIALAIVIAVVALLRGATRIVRAWDALSQHQPKEVSR